MKFKKVIWALRALIYKLFSCKIGSLSYIGKPLYISTYKGLNIGSKVRMYPGLRVEIVDKVSAINIGDNTSLGQNCHIVSKGSLSIGKNTTISANVFISNVNHDYRELDVHILDQELLNYETTIGENCFIGYGAVILPGTILGKQCIVGANSVVKGKFEDYSVIAGNPARVIKRYNFQSNSWEKV